MGFLCWVEIAKNNRRSFDSSAKADSLRMTDRLGCELRSAMTTHRGAKF
jgi:hypothetical protein